MSGDHNMRGEDDDEISTSTHFLPEPAIPHSRLVTRKGVFDNLFTEEQMLRLAKELKEEVDKWKTNYANAMDVNTDLRAKLAERSAEHLAAHITYDKGYQAGRDDTKDAEDEFNRGVEAAQHRLMQMHRIATERHNLYQHAAIELAKLKETT